MPASTPLLSLDSISKSFSGIPVLREVSCDFHAGTVHCLMGENGAGKSTLIKIISGAYTPDQGSIIFEGQKVAHNSPGWARAHGINTIYQEIDLIPTLTAAENMFLGNEPRASLGRIDRRVVRRRAAEILDGMRVDLNLDAPVQDLGIAQQQMVAIAKALTLNSRLIILDEPTAVFTRNEKDTLFALIPKLKSQQIALIFISHHIDEIFEIGDHLIVLRDGKVVSTGPAADYSHDTLVRHMVGRHIDLTARPEKVPHGQEVVAVQGLGDGATVHDVSFSVRSGEVVGVAGLVGAGRTELARLIFGVDRKKTGTVRLNGRNIDPKSPSASLKLRIGMIPEDRKRDGLVLQRPAGENLGYALICLISRFGWVAWSRVRRAANEQIQKLNIKPARASVETSHMSGGNQQKLILGRWLMADVDFLILDEPTRGVDVGARSDIYAIIRALKRKGTAILMVSSDLTEILSQSDRVLVMSKGRLVGEMSGDEATQERILSLALQSYSTEVQSP